MKRVFLIVFAGALAINSSAQQSKVVSAYNYLNYYLKEKDIEQLKKAKENIDEAALNEKTMSDESSTLRDSMLEGREEIDKKK